MYVTCALMLVQAVADPGRGLIRPWPHPFWQQSLAPFGQWKNDCNGWQWSKSE